MKLRSLLLTLLTALPHFASVSHALPVLDSNASRPIPSDLTILRDHVDLARFHILPQRFTTSRDENGRFKFLYHEYMDGDRLQAYVSFAIAPHFNRFAVLKALSDVRAETPCARFDFIPMLKARLVKDSVKLPGVLDYACNVSGTWIGQEITCDLLLNQTGAKLFQRLVQDHMVNLGAIGYEFQLQDDAKVNAMGTNTPIYLADISGDYFFDLNGTSLYSEATTSSLSNDDISVQALAASLEAEWKKNSCDTSPSAPKPKPESEPSQKPKVEVQAFPWLPKRCDEHPYLPRCNFKIPNYGEIRMPPEWGPK